MGMGSEAVVKVKVDAKGCMDVGHLETRILECLAQGRQPFMICCTAGTTVLGAFDPIREVVQVASKFRLWTHVDAALGGTVLLSQASARLTLCLKFSLTLLSLPTEPPAPDEWSRGSRQRDLELAQDGSR